MREENGGEMVLTFTVSRGPLHRLASLDVAGASAVAVERHRAAAALKPAEPFVDARVATVASAITELYRVSGYARAAIKPEEAVVESNGGAQERSVAVTLVVNEGPQTVIGDVSISGASTVAEGRIRALLT